MGGEALPETKSVLFCSTDAGEGAAADAMLKQSIVVASMNMLDLLVIVELKCFVVVAWICFFLLFYKRKNIKINTSNILAGWEDFYKSFVANRNE